MKRGWISVLALLAATALPGSSKGEELVIYSGRSRALVQPVIKAFERETGIHVRVRYGSTAQMAIALQEEGSRSPADLFWAQDPGALGAVSQEGLFAPLSAGVVASVPELFRGSNDQWVATSGRARVLAYAPGRVQERELPRSVFELTDPKWRGRVGWAPSNGSFQAFVSATRTTLGEAETERWLRAMKANGARSYANNTAIVQALAAEEIDLGLPNHYYLLRFRKNDENFPVRQTFFQEGDLGNLVFVSGIGRLKTSRNPSASDRFIQFVLSPRAQQYFMSEIFEYPVIDGMILAEDLVSQEELLRLAPSVNVNALQDLEGTLRLLRKVGLQ